MTLFYYENKHIILSLILFSQLSFAQGQAGSLFLTINPGTRSNAAGEAQIGVANDAYATYYNPAGLTNLSSKEFSFMHTSYLPNLVDDIHISLHLLCLLEKVKH